MKEYRIDTRKVVTFTTCFKDASGEHIWGYPQVVGVYDSIELAFYAVQDLIEAAREAADKDPRTAGSFKIVEEMESPIDFKVSWEVTLKNGVVNNYTVSCNGVTINPDLTYLKEEWERDLEV